jgi:hypothetical protein
VIDLSIGCMNIALPVVQEHKKIEKKLKKIRRWIER